MKGGFKEGSELKWEGGKGMQRREEWRRRDESASAANSSDLESNERRGGGGNEGRREGIALSGTGDVRHE